MVGSRYDDTRLERTGRLFVDERLRDHIGDYPVQAKQGRHYSIGVEIIPVGVDGDFRLARLGDLKKFGDPIDDYPLQLPHSRRNMGRDS